jgi:hypothetical protein
VTEPVLVSVAWPHTIFWFFETFHEDASRNKLRVSANFMILGATVQKLWVFEIFGQDLVRAGMCWSQWGGVDHICKFFGQEEKKKLEFRRGRSLTFPQSDTVLELFDFFDFVFGILRKLRDGRGIWGEWVYNTPIFWSMPLHLEVLNLPFVMDIRDFTIFRILFFSKFRIYLDLHIRHWDFCFMKNWDHKKSLKNR